MLYLFFSVDASLESDGARARRHQSRQRIGCRSVSTELMAWCKCINANAAFITAQTAAHSSNCAKEITQSYVKAWSATQSNIESELLWINCCKLCAASTDSNVLIPAQLQCRKQNGSNLSTRRQLDPRRRGSCLISPGTFSSVSSSNLHDQSRPSSRRPNSQLSKFAANSPTLIILMYKVNYSADRPTNLKILIASVRL